MRLHRTARETGRLIRAEPRTLVACNSKTDRLKLPINSRTRLVVRDAGVCQFPAAKFRLNKSVSGNLTGRVTGEIRGDAALPAF